MSVLHNTHSWRLVLNSIPCAIGLKVHCELVVGTLVNCNAVKLRLLGRMVHVEVNSGGQGHLERIGNEEESRKSVRNTSTYWRT